MLALGGSAVLASISALHLAWGAGSSWPATDRRTLAEEIAGKTEMPPPHACFAVAGALAGAAAIVAGLGGERPLARFARGAVAATMLVRGVTGITGSTRLLVSWTPSDHFNALDKRRYGPLCLAIGSAVAASMITARGAAGE